jgi:hypothetical protein
MNRAGRHAGPSASNSREAALTRELQVGDHVLYRRGGFEKEHLGVIELITDEHYWICTREGDSIRVSQCGQCVFCPPPHVLEQRAKAIRATWYDPQLRAKLGLMPLHREGCEDEPIAAAVADPHERRRRWANARCYR